MSVSAAMRLQALEAEDAQPKKALAESQLEMPINRWELRKER